MSKKVREQFEKEMNMGVYDPYGKLTNAYIAWLEQRLEAGQVDAIVMWQDADTPPNGNKAKWSRKVIAVTNYGNVYSLCYYHGINGGNWQRRVVFEDGEKVLKWTDLPTT